MTVACSSSEGRTASGPAPGTTTTSTTASSPPKSQDVPKREINKAVTVKESDGDTAVVTLVSMWESKGRPDDIAPPESGNYVIVDMSFEGKTGEFFASPVRLRLKKPDGSMIETGDGNGIHAVDVDENLDGGDLTPGKVSRGGVGFDSVLAPGSKIVLLDAFDKSIGEWPLS